VLYESKEEPDLEFDGATGTADCVADAWESWHREVEHAREVQARYADLLRECIDGRTGQ
jgi:hypothetical protein